VVTGDKKENQNFPKTIKSGAGMCHDGFHVPVQKKAGNGV
jgi:hypothetical protein